MELEYFCRPEYSDTDRHRKRIVTPGNTIAISVRRMVQTMENSVRPQKNSTSARMRFGALR
jgi:hypothetical protein